MKKKKLSFKKTLPNGLRIIVAPMRATQAVTLLVLVKTGSKYETKRTNGVSHYLEHLFFKGTTKRPRPEQIARELDRMGAQFNAFTLRETTGYWVKSATKHFDTSLDIIADILLDPLFEKEEIEKERGVIAQELMMYEDMPQRKVFDVWEELLYGNQPAGWPIGGTVDTMRGITRNDIMKYRESQYVGTNTVIVVAGNIDPSVAFQKIGKAFASFKRGHPKGKHGVKERQIKPAQKIFHKKTEQSHVVVGVRAYDMYDDRRYALGLLSAILGGTMSSRLFVEIRERLGLAYYVQSGVESYTDSGYIIARAGVKHDSVALTTNKILEQFFDMRLKGPTDEEVSFAKDHLRGSLALSFESSDEIAQFYAERELFYNDSKTPEEIVRRFEKVTRNDIIQVARDVFDSKKINFALVGPQKGIHLSTLIKDASRYKK
ncbi:MAG: pitrilysin family protein [bacterium]|nr:pitrilysin family protein [bacterium]